MVSHHPLARQDAELLGPKPSRLALQPTARQHCRSRCAPLFRGALRPALSVRSISDASDPGGREHIPPSARRRSATNAGTSGSSRIRRGIISTCVTSGAEPGEGLGGSQPIGRHRAPPSCAAVRAAPTSSELRYADFFDSRNQRGTGTRAGGNDNAAGGEESACRRRSRSRHTTAKRCRRCPRGLPGSWPGVSARSSRAARSRG